MKKIFVLILTTILFWSCNDDLKFNVPALVGEKEGVDWTAVAFNAVIQPNGTVVITGSDNFERLTLTLPSLAEGDYNQDDANTVATFTDIQNVFYSTNNNPNEELQIYPADLEISLTEYDLASNTISGEFHFNAFTPAGLLGVNFSKGFFYRIPVGGQVAVVVDPDDPDLTCQNLEAIVAVTAINFNAVDATDSTYPNLCASYKIALENLIDECGDADGSLQDVVDDLGDCTS